MTESKIKKAIYAQLKKEGFYGWSAPKVKYQETDIFGIFDGVFVKDSEIRWLQWTSVGNIRAREKKINTFFADKKCFIPCEVWGMREDGTFKIIYI
tara:strand:+ start:90 stop:377 length:288 start_codon:yes stop_codon:yes gene_type:complete